jgi:MSHA type pilus biogenesis protein MshL
VVAAALVVSADQVTSLQPLAVTQLDGAAARQAPSEAGQDAARLADPQQATPALPPIPVIQLDQMRTHAVLDGPRFSLSFAEPVPIRDLLLTLVRDTPLSVIPSPALAQTFIGELKQVTVREALDLMLEPLGLDYTVRGNVLRVFPRELETRLYSVDYVITRRSGSRSMSASTSAGGGGGSSGGAPTVAAGATPGGGAGGGGSAVGGAGGGSSAQVSGTDAPDLFADIAAGIRNLLSEEGKFNLDRTAALLQVTDRASRLDLVENYLEAVLLRATRQVQIEAKVIEVELRDEFSAGINWNRILSGLGSAVVNVSQTLAPATTGGFTLALNSGDFTALLNAFSTQGVVNVLSSPRVMAMNNEPAIMRIGTQDVFFVTTTQVDSSTGQILQTTVAPQSLTEGVVLSVTSQISADGIIHMSINPSITERTGVATSRLGDTVPIVSVRETDTLVRVRQGETIVIAGLMQDRASRDYAKVPGLSSVPLIGQLFKRTEKRRAKTDLVILLTPTIMGPSEVAGQVQRELMRLDDARRVADRVR